MYSPYGRTAHRGNICTGKSIATICFVFIHKCCLCVQKNVNAATHTFCFTDQTGTSEVSKSCCVVRSQCTRTSRKIFQWKLWVTFQWQETFIQQDPLDLQIATKTSTPINSQQDILYWFCLEQLQPMHFFISSFTYLGQTEANVQQTTLLQVPDPYSH